MQEQRRKVSTDYIIKTVIRAISDEPTAKEVIKETLYLLLAMDLLRTEHLLVDHIKTESFFKNQAFDTGTDDE